MHLPMPGRLVRSLLAVLTSLVAVAGLSGPSHAVTKLTDAQATSQLSAVGITRVSTGGWTISDGAATSWKSSR